MLPCGLFFAKMVLMVVIVTNEFQIAIQFAAKPFIAEMVDLQRITLIASGPFAYAATLFIYPLFRLEPMWCLEIRPVLFFVHIALGFYVHLRQIYSYSPSKADSF